MLTGWYPRFEKGRGITNVEKADHLALGVSEGVIPGDSTSLISLNSTYADFVDRTFSMKGFAPTLVAGALSVFFVVTAICAIASILPANPSMAEFFAAIFLLSITSGLVYFFWNLVLRHDFFSYRYYPVRFNRLTRKVHIFRSNLSGGEVIVPWGSDALFFHVGRGSQNSVLRDLRCHILDKNGIIIETFTVGIFHDDPGRVRERWEFIKRYMEWGAQRAVSHDADKVITLSVRNTLVNAYRWTCFLLGKSLFPFRYFFFPLYWTLALTRWVVMLTCAVPRFSSATEAESRFDPNDADRWDEPDYIDQFGDRPDVVARARELYRERQQRKGKS